MAGGGLIGKLRVWIGVDNSDYKKGLDQSKQQTGTFAKEVKGNLKSIGTALGITFGIGALVQFGKKIIQTRGEFQSLEISLTSLLRSKQAANELMREMVDLAARTPFSLQDVATGGKQLIAYGFSAKEVTGTLSQLGNVAAGLGLPMERLTYLYGTTRTQGRLFARDLMQFTTSGIPLLDELAKMFGKSTEEVNKMVSAGSIGFEEVKQAFGNMTGEGGKFYNLMEERSKGIAGKISNLGDAIGVMFNNIGKSQEGPINSAIDGAKFLVENYESVWRILKSLIATYGAYKATLIAVAAVQTVKNTIDTVQAVNQLSKALGVARKSQIALNIAQLANPWAVAAAAIGAVVGAMILFSDEVQSTEEVIGDLKKATDAFTDTKVNVSALADEYEKLKSKASLSEVENKRLNEIIAILAKTVPTAITQFDQFGKAIDISSEKVRNFNAQAVKAMQLGLALEINKSTKELKQLDKQLKEARLTAEKGLVLKYNVATGRKDAVEKATAEEIVQAQETYKKLAADRLDLSTQLESSNKTHLSLIKDQFGIAESEQKVAEKTVGTFRTLSKVIEEIKANKKQIAAIDPKRINSDQEMAAYQALKAEEAKLAAEYKTFTDKEFSAKVKVETDKDQLKNAVEGSIAYFENEISKRQLLLKLSTDDASIKKWQKEIVDFEAIIKAKIEIESSKPERQVIEDAIKGYADQQFAISIGMGSPEEMATAQAEWDRLAGIIKQAREELEKFPKTTEIFPEGSLGHFDAKIAELTKGLDELTPAALAAAQAQIALLNAQKEGVEVNFSTELDQAIATLETYEAALLSAGATEKAFWADKIAQQQIAIGKMKEGGQMMLDYGAVIQGYIQNTFGSIGDYLTDLADDGQADAALERVLIKPLADAAVAMGTMLISLGLASETLKSLIKNPWTAIAAGAALVALGTVAGAMAQASVNNATSGKSGGSNNTFTGGYSYGSNSPSYATTNGVSRSSEQTITVKGEVSGDKLRFVLDKDAMRRKS